jgi:Ca2+-binding RTX toxin-like protein
MSLQSLKGFLTDRPYRWHTVKKQLALVVLGLVAVLVASGKLARAAAGPEPSDIQDSLPAWSADGVYVDFERTSPTFQHVLVAASGNRQTSLLLVSGLLRGAVPSSSYLLIQQGTTTVVTTGRRYEGPHAVVEGTNASASADGTHLAYVRGGTLYVSRIDGTEEHAIATGIEPPSSDVTGPVWSPDGTRVAVASGSSLVLVQSDGSSQRTLESGGTANDNPTWSHDATMLAFEHGTGSAWEIWTAAQSCGFCATTLVAGTATNARFPQFSPVSNTLAFISDRQHLRGGATQYQYALYIEAPFGGVERKLVDDVHPYSPPRWSPTAALIAVSAGQECRRWGIYVVRSSVGSRPRRITNRCRYDGTTGNDVLRGSLYFDIVNGLRGNDRLDGWSGNDALYGENGNDTIHGDAGNDFIMGGPGDDRLFGGPGNDVIIGGNGHDRIDCGAGNDTVEGAGPLDRIARNCEHVRR